MKTIEVRKNSWHYWLASAGGYDNRKGKDICTYLRHILGAVVAGILIFVCGVALGGGVIWVVADFIAWVMFLVLHGWVSPDMATGVLLVTGVGAGIGVPYLVWRGTKKAVEDSEALHAVWDSVHNRICARITFR